jgi:uncharacterized protein (TIGR02145 family)
MKKYLILIVLAFALFSGCKKDPFVTDNSGTFQDSRDKHEYSWVKIGSQIWMAENMAHVPYVNPSTVQSVTEARSYVYGYQGTNITEAMATANYAKHGGLYNFEAAKIACPDGWHLPTDQEWKTMEMSLGLTQAEADNLGLRTSGSLGLKLKSASAWTGGSNTNSSGFNALPSGYLGTLGFDQLGTAVVFWTATPDEGGFALDRFMDNTSDGIDRGPWPRNEGYSVRCVRN